MKRLLSSSLLLFSLVFAAGQTAFAQQAAGDNGDAPAESAAGNDTAATAQDKARQQREACLLRAAPVETQNGHLPSPREARNQFLFVNCISSQRGLSK